MSQGAFGSRRQSEMAKMAGNLLICERNLEVTCRIVNFRLRHFSRRSRDRKSQSMKQNKVDSNLREVHYQWRYTSDNVAGTKFQR